MRYNLKKQNELRKDKRQAEKELKKSTKKIGKIIMECLWDVRN